MMYSNNRQVLKTLSSSWAFPSTAVIYFSIQQYHFLQQPIFAIILCERVGRRLYFFLWRTTVLILQQQRLKEEFVVKSNSDIVGCFLKAFNSSIRIADKDSLLGCHNIFEGSKLCPLFFSDIGLPQYTRTDPLKALKGMIEGVQACGRLPSKVWLSCLFRHHKFNNELTRTSRSFIQLKHQSILCIHGPLANVLVRLSTSLVNTSC